MKAKFSDCGKYRYLLWEIWDDTKPVLAWCLFNPSKAGATEGDQMATDQTWTKGIGFSKRLGYGGQVVNGCQEAQFFGVQSAVSVHER